MTHTTKEKPAGALESTILINGRLMPRCQARAKATGEQCRQPARRGYKVCKVHGVGTAKREAEGERRPPGRPPTHGLYSRKGLTSILALRDEVRALELDLDNTDEELVTLKATLWFLLEQADKYSAKAVAVDTALEKIEELVHQSPSESSLDPATAKALLAEMRTGHRFLSELSGYSNRLMDSAVKVITMVKARAETKAKLAETKALEHFTTLAQSVRDIVWDLLDDELLDIFEDRLRRELYGPNNLELPDRELN